MATATLLEDLDREQRTAVEIPTNPLCIVARAGSGKTRVLTRRIAWRMERRDIDVRRTLAITFTTRAARELRERLGTLLGRDMPVTGTFHAIAFRMVRDHCDDHRRAVPTVLDDPDRLLADVWTGSGPAPLRQLRSDIAWAQARRLTPESYVAAAVARERTGSIAPERAAEMFAAYQREKRRRGVVDFDDLLAECVRLFEQDPEFARVQRWRFRHFFVDEYQDVNPLQQQLLDVWLGGREDLCVVGDPNQAIYGFNGADAGYIENFPQRYPGATVVELSTNHRSSGAIVRVADAALAGPVRRSSLDAGETPTVTACADDQAEALIIARRLRDEHLPGTLWRSQAVLVRTHAQTRQIAELLDRAGIPVRVRGESSTRDAVDLLSFHSAKGLEWPIVHLAGLEEGLVPEFHARTPSAIAEERRLLHVAATRAARRLHCTWAQRRTMRDRTFDRKPSRWLADIEAAIADCDGTIASPRALGGPRIPVPPAGTATDIRDRLEDWRAIRARAASMPPAVILSDAVLDELARSRPETDAQLRDVPGMNMFKVDRFGPALLEILQSECP